MSFAHPQLFFLVMPLVVAGLVLGYVLDIARRRRAALRLGEEPLMRQMTAALSLSKLIWRAALVVLGAACLLTDGDNNSGNISPSQAARFARTLGVKVYTVLMGQNDDGDPFGRRSALLRRYPVNPKLLEEIAAVTGGSPYLATDTQALDTRFHQILEELERSKLKDASVARTPCSSRRPFTQSTSWRCPTCAARSSESSSSSTSPFRDRKSVV